MVIYLFYGNLMKNIIGVLYHLNIIQKEQKEMKKLKKF